MKSFHAAAAKAALILMGLGSIARADDVQTIINEGKLCPLLFDLIHGGNWRNLSPAVNDVLVCPDFTFITTGIA